MQTPNDSLKNYWVVDPKCEIYPCVAREEPIYNMRGHWVADSLKNLPMYHVRDNMILASSNVHANGESPH